MSNITIDDGREAITINGDPNRVIYVQATDFNIKVRAQEAQNNIKEYLKKIKKAKAKTEAECIALLTEADKECRKQLNLIFNYDVSTPVFGACSPLMPLENGKIYAEAFLEAIIPELDRITEKATKASEKRIAKHTARYAK